MNELALSSITNLIEPSINNLVLTFIKIVENNNSTKIALEKIDSDMRIAISKIQGKSNAAASIIQACSNIMQKKLNDSSLPFEQQTALIDKFTKTMLDTLDKL